LERGPGGIGQVVGGFDEDGDAGCTGDGEAETAVAEAEVRGGGLDLGVPEQGGATGKCGSPATRARQVNTTLVLDQNTFVSSSAGEFPLK
jgi:hypothetical protein